MAGRGWEGRYDGASDGDGEGDGLTQIPKATLTEVAINHINFIASSVLIGAPLVFALSGWLVGLGLCVVYGLAMAITASWLCRSVESAGRGTPEWPAASLPDLCRIVFKSETAYTVVSWCFFLELFGSSVSGVSVMGDQFQLLVPSLSANTIKLLATPFLLAFSCIPSRHTHFLSSLGIICGIAILCTVVYDGVATTSAPGSLLEPSETRVFPEWTWDGFASIARASGIVVYASAGHSPLPPLYFSMKSRVRNRDKEIGIAFGVSTLAFVATGGVGYLMFGPATADQITKNLDEIDFTPFQDALNTFLTFLIAFIPFTVVGLTVEPLVLDLDSYFERIEKQTSRKSESCENPSDKRQQLVVGWPTRCSRTDIPRSKERPVSSFAPESPRLNVGSTDTLVDTSEEWSYRSAPDDDAISIISDVPSDFTPPGRPSLDEPKEGEDATQPPAMSTRDNRRFTLRIVITCCVVGVSILLPSFSFVSAIVGASVVCIDSIVLPAVCFLMVAKVGDHNRDEPGRVAVSRGEVLLARCVAVFGTLVCLFSFVGTLLSN